MEIYQVDPGDCFKNWVPSLEHHIETLVVGVVGQQYNIGVSNIAHMTSWVSHMWVKPTGIGRPERNILPGKLTATH